MKLQSAIDAISGACGKVEPYDHIHFGDGKVWAFDSSVFFLAPVDVQGEFSVKGSTLKTVLQKLPDAVATFSKDQLILRQNGAKATIDTIPRTLDLVEMEGKPFEGWEGWLETMVELAQAVSPDATQDWLRGILCYKDCTAVVGAGTSFMAWCDMPALGGATAIIPAEPIKMIKSREGIKSLRLADNYFLAEFTDGVKFRTQMIRGEPPPVVKNKRKDWKAPTWNIADSWRDSVLRACALCDGVVMFEKNKVTAADTGLFMEDEAGGGQITGNFSAKTLELLLSMADKASGDGFPLCWEGPRSRGFMTGRGR